MGGSSCDLDLTCCPSSSVEGLLKPSESFKGTFRGSGDPTFPESLFKSGRLSKPGGDGRPARDATRAVAKRETNRKVIGERGTGGPDGVIGGVMRDVNNRVKQGVSTDRGRGQEPVQTRRPGVLRGRCSGVDVEVSVSVMFHVDHPKVGLKTFPNVQKTTRGRARPALEESEDLSMKLRSPQTKVGTEASQERRYLMISVLASKLFPPETR